MLAWRLQATAFGGLDRETRRVLARSGPVQAEGLDLGPGTVLRREWRGEIAEVHVGVSDQPTEVLVDGDFIRVGLTEPALAGEFLARLAVSSCSLCFE